MSLIRPLAALGAALLVTACAAATQEETGAADIRNVDEVTDNPERYIGRSITVRGEMDDVRSPRSFTLEDHDWVFPEELLVIAPNQPATMTGDPEELEDTEVTVTGTLRRLVVSEVEREYDLDLEQEFEVEFRDRPVLIADRISPDPTAGEAARPGEGADTAAAAGADTVTAMVRPVPVTDILVIVPVPGPSELVGREVRLTDVNVRTQVGDQGLWIGPSHDQQVFVRTADAQVGGLQPNDRVSISGTLRQVPPVDQIRSQWGLDETQAGLVGRAGALYVEADSVTVQE